MGSPGQSSRSFRCSGAPTSPSHALSNHSTKEVPSSSSSPPPTQCRTTPCQLSITLPTSCFMLQTTPTKGTTAAFITSTFSPITSPLRAGLSISLLQVSQDNQGKVNLAILTCRLLVLECNKIKSTKHFWSFTAKQRCSILLNNWSGWRLVLKCKKQTTNQAKMAAFSIIQVSRNTEIVNWFDRMIFYNLLSRNLHCSWKSKSVPSESKAFFVKLWKCFVDYGP